MECRCHEGHDQERPTNVTHNPLDDLSVEELAERAAERLEKEQAINRELRDENTRLRAALAHIGGV